MTSGKWQRNVLIHNQCCTFQVMSTASRQMSLVTEMRGEFPSPHTPTVRLFNNVTHAQLSARALSLPRTALRASRCCPGYRGKLQPWRGPTVSFAGRRLCTLSPAPLALSSDRSRCLEDPGANSSRSGSSEQVSYNRIYRTRPVFKAEYFRARWQHTKKEWVWILSSINDISGLTKVESHYWLHFLFRLLVKHHFFHWGPPMHQRVSLCSAGRCRHRALVPGFTEGADQLTDPH